jgi:non-homologous end joining protein Ku
LTYRAFSTPYPAQSLLKYAKTSVVRAHRSIRRFQTPSLGALRVADGLIVLEQLHFADEARPVEGIKPEGQRVSKQELEMASKLIDSYTGRWKLEKTRTPTGTSSARRSRRRSAGARSRRRPSPSRPRSRI